MHQDMIQLLSEHNFNKSELARKLEVTPQAVALAYANGYFSNPLALKIETLTNGKFKAVNLCKNSL